MEDEISLLVYWRVLVKWRKTIVWMVLIVSLSTTIISLFLPRIYQAKATIMPIEDQKMGSTANLAISQIGLGGLMGSMRTSSALRLMAILKSRSLAERLIDKYNLRKILFARLWDHQNQKWITNDPKKIPTMENATGEFFLKVSFNEDKKTQLIEIKAEMQDPKMAAGIVNSYLKELALHINENTFSIEKKNRLFIENLLEKTKLDVLNTGKELSEFYSVNKVSNTNSKIDIKLFSNSFDKNIADITPNLPHVLLETQKLIEEENEKMQRVKILKNIPQQVYLQYLTEKLRLLKEMNALLTQQYEMAKIEETREDLSFQVIDWARIPEKHFKPKRVMIATTTLVSTLFMALCYAFFREYLESLKSNKNIKIS